MVLVEVMRRNYLASIVPVIVNAVLNEHQLVFDIVAFVAKGDFPRSRLGEKQRGKILASWVTRKMETIAQFSIRDGDGADSQITEVAEPRSAVGSVRVGSSLKNVETVPTAPRQQGQDYASTPAAMSEMPVPYESSIVESPPLPTEEDRENTPTEVRNNHHLTDGELPSPNAELQDSDGYPQPTRIESSQRYDYDDVTTPQSTRDNTSFDFSNTQTAAPPDPRYDSKPSVSLSSAADDGPIQESDLWTLPSQQPPPQQGQQSSYGASGSGGPRGASSNSVGGSEWPQEALMHMNLGSGGRAHDRYDGSGYGNAM